jgi:outer membrane protein assembly factor BamB
MTTNAWTRVLCTSIALAGAALLTPARAASDAPAGAEDALAEVRKMNSDAYGKPPAKFRSGSASPQPLSAKQVARNAKGFEIRLPSGTPLPTPAVHQGVLVTSGGFHSREVHAFDAQTGAPLWGIGLSDDGPSAPACARGVCVWNTESCTIFAVEVRSGKLLWSHYLGDPQLSAPAIGGTRVFTVYPASVQKQPPGASHVLAAFDLQSGKLLWQRWIDGDAISAPVAAEDEVHVSSMAGTLFRVRQSDGAILSARRVRATSAPTVAKGNVYYAKRVEAEGSAAPQEGIARRDKVAAEPELRSAGKRAPYLDKSVQRRSGLASKGKDLDASNGFGSGAPASAKAAVAESNIGQGSVSTLQAFQGSRVLKDGKHTIATMGDEVVATDTDSGKELWKRRLKGDLARSGGFLAAPPLSAGGRVLVGTLDGEIQLLDPATGKLARTYALGVPIRSQPIVEGGWIYVGSEDGRLIALRTDDASLTGWPQWGRDAMRAGSVD